MFEISDIFASLPGRPVPVGVRELLAEIPTKFFRSDQKSSAGQDQISQELREANWSTQPNGTAVVAVKLSEPAVDAAVVDLVARINMTLIDRPRKDQHSAVRRVRADVSAKTAADGFPCYIEPGSRFSLHEERIRALLMGEGLYGDPSLALRELYQNAVDATRRANARLEHIRRRGTSKVPPTVVKRQIEITQGVTSEGSAFVECRDQGIGMSVADLTRTFTHAGMRAIDDPLYAQEVEEYAKLDPPIEAWTNSLFGIGALSYFMIAHTVELRTARLEADGSIGPLVTASIPGPTQMMHIRQLGDSDEHGTSIRLYLRTDREVTSVASLRDLVVVAPFDTHIRDERTKETHSWTAGEPNLGSLHLKAADHLIKGSRNSWWLDGQGAVVADGIWCGAPAECVLVDLRGSDALALTANRTHTVALDHQRVDTILVDTVKTLTPQTAPFLSPSWLDKLSARYPRTADAVVQHASQMPTWPLKSARGEDGLRWDIAQSGYVTNDGRSTAFTALPLILWQVSRSAALQQMFGLSFDPSEPIVRARPSDALLLPFGSGVQYATGYSGSPVLQRAQSHALTGQDQDQILDRQIELGLITSGQSDHLNLPLEMVNFLIATARATHTAPPPAAAFWEACLRHSLDPAQVADDLKHLGVEMPSGFDGLVDSPPTPVELTLARLLPRLKADLSLRDLARSAQALDIHVVDASAMAGRLGYRVPIRPQSRFDIDEVDIALVDTRASSTWSRGTAVSLPAIFDMAYKLKMDVADARQRLRRLGFLVPPLPAGSAAVAPALRHLVGAFAPPEQEPVPVAAAVCLARMTDIPIEDIVRSYELTGARVSPGRAGFDIDDVDITLASEEGDGEPPFHRMTIPINPVRLRASAYLCRLGIDEAKQRYENMGYVVASSRPTDDLTPEEFQLLGVDFRRSPSYRFIDLDKPVSVARVIEVCYGTDSTVAAIVAAYSKIGMEVEDPRSMLPLSRPGDLADLLMT